MPSPPVQGPCFHGGAFFAAVGPEFDDLSRRERIVSADVLDAWFPPSPRALAMLQEHLPWLLSTSPPTDCEGLVQVLARTRGVPAQSLLVGAGSSDLIFLALPRWLDAGSRAVLLDPTYGEYRHVLEHVVGCRVDALPLERQRGYRVDPEALLDRCRHADADLLVLVNPNSPTGQHLPREHVLELVRRLPARTIAWLDETYVDYVDPGQSLESFAAEHPGVVVCKSMSKTYALSGARVAYLCAHPETLASLRALVPPWAVSLPAQVAAVAALGDGDYYASRYAETRELRRDLVAGLAALDGVEPLDGVANFVLCQLADCLPTAAEVVARCRERGVFLRDAGGMGQVLGDRALRVAVKDAEANARIVATLRRALRSSSAR